MSDMYFDEEDQRWINPLITPDAIRKGLREIANSLVQEGGEYELEMTQFQKCTDIDFVNTTMTNAYIRMTMLRVKGVSDIGTISIKRSESGNSYIIKIVGKQGSQLKAKKKKQDEMIALQTLSFNPDLTSLPGEPLEIAKSVIGQYRNFINEMLENK